MVFGVEPELCNSYEVYFGSGTKLTVLGKFGLHVVINDLQENIQKQVGCAVLCLQSLKASGSNKEREKPKLKLSLWVPAQFTVTGSFEAFFGGGTKLTVLGKK